MLNLDSLKSLDKSQAKIGLTLLFYIMKLTKKLLKKSLLVITFFGLAFFLIFILYFSLKSYFPKSSTPIIVPVTLNNFISPEQKIKTIGLPLRLKIPEINLDASVESVGLTSDGAMDTPKSTKNVGWFEIGQRPGEIGSAVIAGHYGISKGKSSVFDNLYKLRPGDKVYIEDASGEIVSFVVRGSKRFNLKADASEVFSSIDGKAHVNLITCEGVWNNDLKSYSKRLVVFTDKE